MVISSQYFAITVLPPVECVVHNYTVFVALYCILISMAIYVICALHEVSMCAICIVYMFQGHYTCHGYTAVIKFHVQPDSEHAHYCAIISKRRVRPGRDTTTLSALPATAYTISIYGYVTLYTTKCSITPSMLPT